MDERFRALFQFEEKRPEPNGLDPSWLFCWGIEPALNLDSKADVELLESVPKKEEDLKGLVEGVGLELLDWADGVLPRPGGAAGENLEGTVPARGRRIEFWVVASEGGRKSGNPS